MLVSSSFFFFFFFKKYFEIFEIFFFFFFFFFYFFFKKKKLSEDQDLAEELFTVEASLKDKRRKFHEREYGRAPCPTYHAPVMSPTPLFFR